MRAMGRTATRLVAAVAAFMLFGPALAAHAATATSVTMLSDTGDYIGGGVPRLFHPGNAQIAASGNTGDLSLSVSGGTSGDSYTLQFAAPPGAQLAPGVYDSAQRAPFREAGRPGIDIGGDGRGCNTIDGRFEVKDITVSSSGTLDRLWIVYEQHCEGGLAALFGEVKVGMPAADGVPIAAPGVMRWPEGESGRPGSVQPVTFIAPPGGVQIASVAVTGANAGDFTVRTDECSGRSVAAGGTCQVWVRFVPTAPATRTAKLVLRDSAGRAIDADLQGWSHGGRSRLVMASDPGDYIGQGRSWSHTAADSVINAAGSRSGGVGFGVTSSAGPYWSGEIRPGAGDIIAPGRYDGAQRAAFASGGSPGLEITGNGRGCNTISGSFTVNEAAFEPDGALRSFGATFEQHCEGGAPALRGTFEFRVGDDAAPAPWMAGGQAAAPGTSAGDTAGGGGGGGGGGGPAAAAGPCPDRMSLMTATRRGTRRGDRIRGGAKAELLLGYRGSDRISAGGGADCVDGGPGNDRINGGAGADMLLGGPGRDVIVGGAGRDLIDCGSGRDVVKVGRGDRTRNCERKLR
jgi:hypothetical protein